MKPKVTFICTGMCGAAHPIYDHCKDCSHANFRMTVGRVVVNFNPLFGAEFSIKNWKRIDAPENSFLWEVAKELTEFADRNFKKWKGKKT